MTGEKNIDEKVKELLARPIESMSDARAIVHVGKIVDLGADLHSSDITEKAIQLLDALGTPWSEAILSPVQKSCFPN